MWPYATCPWPGPLRLISIGSATTCCLPTETTVAVENDEYACAATRSDGIPPWPNLSSDRSTVSAVTSPGAFTATVAAAVATAVPSCRPRRRRSGVNRHNSSRPPGTSKASTSYELNSSPLLMPVPSTAPARFDPPGVESVRFDMR
ncbi:Uncharacterised protein [Mycobacteroides abscessus subsp. abscessus]|nr:Uncharacterised protein [Mycobacteroides abscessus subsp. abscessus]